MVDTGLTLNYLTRVLALRLPTSIAIATLFDRPYRRLVDDLPVRYVGFTVPDELFAGYGFDLDERFRNLPDIHLTTGTQASGTPSPVATLPTEPTPFFFGAARRSGTR